MTMPTRRSTTGTGANSTIKTVRTLSSWEHAPDLYPTNLRTRVGEEDVRGRQRLAVAGQKFD